MTTLGVFASSVVAGTDVLLEPFNNFTDAPWTLNGSPVPSIVTGRTGTGASCGGTAGRADYTIPSGARTTTVTVGFAWRTNTTSASARQVITLWTDANANESIRVAYNGTTAQSFTVTRLGGGTAVGTTPTGLVPVNTYAYLELQSLCDNTAGTVIFRVNGVELINVTGIKTAPSGTGLVDTIRIGPLLSAHTNIYDDLYLSEGAGAPFKGSITIP